MLMIYFPLGDFMSFTLSVLPFELFDLVYAEARYL